MKILLASSECAPYIKVGGLGDVIPALATQLKKFGHDARIVLPKYGSINYVTECNVVGGPMIVNMGYGIEFAQLLQTEYNGVDIYLIEFDKYFSRNGVYGENGTGYCDNWERFAFFSRAVIDMCQYLNWSPDIIQSNDWPTGLIPALLTLHNRPEMVKCSKSVFAIHNMAHHGYAPKDLISFVGLYDHYFHPFAMEACGAVNVMKGALQFANKITTVSKNYAEEIKTAEHGYGLDDVLRYRAKDLVGICNGIDTKIWDPETDKFLVKSFSATSMAGKLLCKEFLQNEVGLPVDGNIPLFGVVSRFAEQKGLDVLCDVLQNIVDDMNVQFIVLGSGDPVLEQKFNGLCIANRKKIFARIGFDNKLSHWIEAGCDFFVMPSRYEPCGLNQMYSMVYGTLPIVRSTGGLADTVENYDEANCSGTGFVFQDLTTAALYNTIGWACSTYFDRPDDFKRLQKNAMKKGFSWEKSAKKYIDVYRSAIDLYNQ